MNTRSCLISSSECLEVTDSESYIFKYVVKFVLLYK